MLKWVLIGLGALLVLALGLLAAVPWLVDTPKMQAYVSQTASQALGRPVRFAALSISAFPLPSVRLRDLQVAEDPRFGTTPVLSVQEGRIGIRLLPLFRGRVELADLTLEKPRLEVIEQRGQLNLATLGAPASTGKAGSRGGPGGFGSGAAAGVMISQVKIEAGAVHYQKRGPQSADFTLENINLILEGAGTGEAVQFKGDAIGNPGGVRLRISDGIVGLGGGRSLADVPVKASVDVEVKDLGPLGAVALASPGVAGPMQGRLQVSGTPSQLTASGDVRIDRLTLFENRPQCPAPKVRKLTMQDVRMPLAYSPVKLDSAPLQAKVGGGSLSVQLSVAFQAAQVVTIKDINVKGLELSPVLVDYFCQPYAVSGPLDLTGETALRAADLWRTMNGSGQLRIGPGKVVGSEALATLGEVARLAGVLSALLRPEGQVAIGSPVAFDSITATYRITNGVVNTPDLLYQSASVNVAAAGTYGLADGRVDMDVTVSQGQNQVRGKIVGTTVPRNLRIIPTGIQQGGKDVIQRSLEKLFR